MQVVSPDELFYEILIRQRAERAKFVAAYDATEKQSANSDRQPDLRGCDSTWRGRCTRSRGKWIRLLQGLADSLQEMKLNQVGSPKSHRLLQDGVIDPIRALNAGPAGELRGVLQALANGSKTNDDGDKARQLHGEVVTRMKDDP